MKEAILHWINSRQHYDTGVALYEAHGNDFAIKRMLRQGHSPFRQKVLANALKAIAAEHIERLEQPAQSQQATETVGEPVLQLEPGPAETNQTKPSQLEDPFKSEWIPLFVEMNTLRHQLRYILMDVERAEAAVKILSLREQCKALWEKRDYFQRTGEMPPADPLSTEPTADPNQLQKRLNNVATYITKARKALNSDPTNQKKAAKLSQYLAERESLVKRLEGHGTDQCEENTPATGGSYE